MSTKIPIYDVKLTGNEKKYVNECIDTSWISSRGKFIKLFEDSFSEYIGVKHSASVCNGTVALHLALVTLDIGPGDEVIVPSFTYVASVSAIVYTGALPVFVNSLKETWQMDPEDIKRKITTRTKAIMAVHIYGHPCDMDAITNLARDNGLYLIEDAAEAFGSEYKGKHTGTFGDISTFSFYGNKTITTGEGGMLVTNSAELHDKAYHLKMHAVSNTREYWHDAIGYNYRMTNICAAIGLAQLEQADEILKRKREVAECYTDLLKASPVTPHIETKDVTHSYWMYSILTRTQKERDALRSFLKEAGIETRPAFPPVNTMPMFSKNNGKFPVAEMLGSCGLNLPSWHGLNDEQIKFICDKIFSFFDK
jgi:perosamine synthetase